MHIITRAAGRISCLYSLPWLTLCFTSIVYAQETPDPPPSAGPSSIDLGAIGTSIGFGLTEDLRASALLARFTEIDANYVQFGITKLSENLLIYGSDYILIDPDSGSSQHTLRSHVSYGTNWNSIRFDARAALEYRFAQNEVTERWRGRTRLRATYQNDHDLFRFEVYLSVEPNYDFSANELQQTNYSIGFKPWLTEKSNLDMSYIFVDSNSGTDLNLFAVTLNFELD